MEQSACGHHFAGTGIGTTQSLLSEGQTKIFAEHVINFAWPINLGNPIIMAMKILVVTLKTIWTSTMQKLIGKTHRELNTRMKS
jgi:hypothetical protein